MINEDQNMRLECLHLASRCAGEDVAYDYVLEAARKFVDFVLGPQKANLKIVKANDDEGGF